MMQSHLKNRNRPKYVIYSTKLTKLQVHRGEHIKKEQDLEAGGNRGVKNINKRQADYEDYYGSGEEYEEDYYEDEKAISRQTEVTESDSGVIPFNQIDTQCPTNSSCVETFYCKQFSGNSPRDKIVSFACIGAYTRLSPQPCLVNSGRFAGEFGICCVERHERVCPKEVRTRPREEVACTKL